MTLVEFHGTKHNEKSHGKRGKGADSKVFKEKSIHEAAQAMAEGRHVRLDKTKTAYTLLDKLAAMAIEAEAKGEKAPNYDLCNVSVKGTNLFCESARNIRRINMPQMAGKPAPGSPADKLPKDEQGQVDLSAAFVGHLISEGVTVSTGSERADRLRATQREINGAKVSKIMKKMRKEPDLPKWSEPLFISKENYIVDGHHRWAAAVGNDAEDGRLGDTIISVQQIDLSILRLLVEAKKFTTSMGIAPRGITASVLEFHGTPGDPDYPHKPRNSALSDYLQKMRVRPMRGVAGVYKVRVEHTDRSRGPDPGEHGREGAYNTVETEVEVDAHNETDALEQAYTMVHARIGEGMVLEQRVVSVKPHRATRGNSSVVANDRSKIVKLTDTPAPGHDNPAAVRASRGEKGTGPERRIPHQGETVDIYRDLSWDKTGNRARKRGFPDHAAFSMRNASGANGNSAVLVKAATVGIVLDNPRPAWNDAAKRGFESEQIRGVHAFMRGEVNEYLDPEAANAIISQPGWQQITYFPGSEDFFDPETRRRFMGAEKAVGVNGKFYVLNPEFHVATAPDTRIEQKRRREALRADGRLVELWATAKALQELHATHNQKDHGRRESLADRARVRIDTSDLGDDPIARQTLIPMRLKEEMRKIAAEDRVRDGRKTGWKPMMSREEAEDWARDSAVKELTTFVGSQSKVEEIKNSGFDLDRSGSGSGNVWGPGLYSSLDSNLVTKYYGDKINSRGEVVGEIRQVVHEPSAQYKSWKEWRNPVVVRLKVNVKNPATIDLREKSGTIGPRDAMRAWVRENADSLKGVESFLDRTDYPDWEDFEDENGNPDWDAYYLVIDKKVSASQDFGRFLQANGYDSLIVLEDGFSDMVGGSQIVVFDPKNVTVVDPETDPSHHLFASAQRIEQLRLAVRELQEFHGEEHNEKSHGNWAGRKKAASRPGAVSTATKVAKKATTKVAKKATKHGDSEVLDVPSTKYGMKFDESHARRSDVMAAKKWKGWDDLPTTKFKPSAQPVLANEEHLQSKAIDKVVSGKVALREGYDPHILIDEDGKAHVIDGHHRVAMYMGLEKDVMPSKVWDVRERGPIPGSNPGARAKIGSKNLTRRSTASQSNQDSEGPTGTKSTLSAVNEARVQAATRDNLAAVQHAEKTATSDLSEIATARPGGHLIGLDYKFKSKESLARKIRDKAKAKGIAPADVKITDSLRYTIAFDHDTFADSLESALEDLDKKGYKLVEMENFWPHGDAYNGINSLFAHPDGTVFEVQFHTDESFKVKDKDIHKYYEEFRALDTTPQRKKELFEIMRKISDSQPTPPGIERICCLTFRGLD